MQNRTRGIETWNRLIAVRGEGLGEDLWKEGEGISTYEVFLEKVQSWLI